MYGFGFAIDATSFAYTMKRYTPDFLNLIKNLGIPHTFEINYLQFVHTDITRWFHANNISNQYDIPRCIRCSTKSNIYNFLDGFWLSNSERSIAKGCWSGPIPLVNKKFAVELVQLCRAVGFVTFITSWGVDTGNCNIVHKNKDLANDRKWNGYWLDPIFSIEYTNEYMTRTTV